MFWLVLLSKLSLPCKKERFRNVHKLILKNFIIIAQVFQVLWCRSVMGFNCHQSYVGLLRSPNWLNLNPCPVNKIIAVWSWILKTFLSMGLMKFGRAFRKISQKLELQISGSGLLHYCITRGNKTILKHWVLQQKGANFGLSNRKCYCRSEPMNIFMDFIPKLLIK